MNVEKWLIHTSMYNVSLDFCYSNDIAESKYYFDNPLITLDWDNKYQTSYTPCILVNSPLEIRMKT